MTVGVLVPAAGRGERLNAGVPKAFATLAGEPLLVHAVRGLRTCVDVGPIVVAVPRGDQASSAALLSPYDVGVVEGGASRTSSVALALAALPPEARWVLVHDAARALTPADVITRVVAALLAGADAVIPVVELADTVRQVSAGRVVGTPDRAGLRAVQTPQGFRRAVLEQAHALSAAVSDDAGLVELLGVPVHTVPGSPDAFKVTRPLDLLLAEAVLRAR